jgi:hypothetical protein
MEGSRELPIDVATELAVERLWTRDRHDPSYAVLDRPPGSRLRPGLRGMEVRRIRVFSTADPAGRYTHIQV